MPRRGKGPRLYWNARPGRAPVWEIRDTGGTKISTGTDCREKAEIAFAQYVDQKQRPGGPAAPHELTISQVLSIYADERGPDLAAPDRAAYAIEALDRFWGNRAVSDISGATCRRYTADRGVSPSTVRRELGVLQAALRHCGREGYLTGVPDVWRPASAPPVERWLSRQEAAWLLRAARSLRKDGRHLADFILCGLYTGSRKATILAMHIDRPNVLGGYIDTQQGVMYRRPASTGETSKRRRPARLPAKYLAHIRRQTRNGRRYVVQGSDGAMVGDIRRGWAHAVELAEKMAAKRDIKLDLTQISGAQKKPITPHVLKHTAITWALQRGATIWDAAGYFSTSAETIDRVYGHHSPRHQESAVDAMNRRY